MPEYLCIGGPKDGETRNANGSFVRFPIYDTTVWLGINDRDMTARPNYAFVTYSVHRIRSHKWEGRVLAHSQGDLTPENLTRTLIWYCRQEPRKEPRQLLQAEFNRYRDWWPDSYSEDSALVLADLLEERGDDNAARRLRRYKAGTEAGGGHFVDGDDSLDRIAPV